MSYHKPVLLRESIAGLDIRPGGTYVDATFGGGGHSKAILEKLENGRLFAFDQDRDTLRNAPDDERLTLINHNFRYLKNFLKYYESTPVDGILADLGVSSHQFDEPGRGFSIRSGGEIDLRMNRNKNTSAQDVLNQYPENELTGIFREYGELPEASAIAGAIVRSREKQPVKTFEELSACLNHLVTRGKENKFFAQVMQALRIEVNEEMQALREFLTQSVDVLKKGGRLVVISYHSLEDRPVKNLIKAGNFEGTVKKDFYGNPEVIFRAINKKPVTPSAGEIAENNRARSAKLRIAEKIQNE